MESAHGHGHGPPNAQPPPLHPAMLIANPFVAYAMTNQLIPPAGAPPSVLPGQVIGSPQFIGHHLAGIPGFPGAHHLMGHALSPQQLLPPTSIASPPMNLPPGSWPPNARPIHGNIRDYPPPDFKARESPPEEEIRREDPRSPMNHRSSPSRWPRGVDPYQRRETRDRDPYERRSPPRQPSERRPAYGGDDNRDRDRERGRAYKDRRDEYDSRRNDESWGRRERDSSREREVRSRDRDRDRDRYRERDRDYPSRREGDDRRDGERHRSRSRERDRERDRRSRWNDEERADRGRSRRSRDKSRERRKGERERPMEVQVEFEDGELPEMITEAGTVAQEHRENDREEEHRSEREMVDERVREPSRREDDDRRDRDRREDDVDQRRPDEDEDRRPRERRDEERESGRSRRRSEEREKERERREPRPRLTRVLIRNLDRNMRDDQLAEEVTLSGALPLAVHVMRYRLAGAECSQGFGFVSFYRMEDALVWLERCKYSLKMPGNTEVPMELLSAPPDNMDDDDLDRIRRRTDWACCICRKRNNRRDHRCGSCYAKREDSEVLDGIEDVCSGLSDTILVRNLEPWTTQDNILRVLQATTPLPIKKIELRGGGRSGATCRIELYSSKDANTLMRALEGRDIVTPGGREPVFCFARLPAVETQNVAPNIAIGSAQWAATSQQEQPQILPDSSTDAVGREMPVYDPTNKEASLKSLAEHSASAYAKNPQEWQYYLNYYLNYYRQQADSGALISVKTQSDAALAAASAVRGAVAKAIANPAPQMATGAKPAEIDRTLIGKPGVKLPLPDTLKYVFDSASGLYLDPVTHLYYDQRSQYYYDATNTCYLYWNAKEQNYFPVPQPGAAPNAAVAANENKKEKAKEAQKIAKEMEKWAKSMNQKKDTNKQTSNQGTNSATSDKPASTGAADAGFAVLQGKSSVSIAPFKFGMVSVKTAKPLALPVVEAEEEEEQVAPMPKNGKESEADFTDWHKLACLLCQRRFPSREVLEKHNLISGLHKSNLENWRKAGGK